jgi:hypothetical protein
VCSGDGRARETERFLLLLGVAVTMKRVSMGMTGRDLAGGGRPGLCEVVRVPVC